MTLATNKQLGFVAAILTVIGLCSSFLNLGRIGYPLPAVPNLNVGFGLPLAFLSLIGFILFLVAMYGLSKDFQDPAIFNYVLYGLVAAIVIGVVVGGVAIFIVLSRLGNLTPGMLPSIGTQFFEDYFESVLPVFLVSSFLGLLPALFNMWAFNHLANRSEVRMFRTVGLLGVVASAVTIALWFVGAALFYAGTIALRNIFVFSIVDSAISLAAWVLAAKAFHSITVPSGQAAAAQATQAGQAKYCPYCGAPNTWEAEYCVRCGRKQ